MKTMTVIKIAVILLTYVARCYCMPYLVTPPNCKAKEKHSADGCIESIDLAMKGLSPLNYTMNVTTCLTKAVTLTT